MSGPENAPTTGRVGRWSVTRTRGPAASLHERPVPDHVVPSVWVHHTTRPALVLGSTQPLELVHIDAAAAAGVEICRRRSGGGLVPIEPESNLWVDVVVPSGDPLWHDDIGRSFEWLGRVWADALRDIGVESTVTVGRWQPGPLGRLWCFAGLGPGEVVARGRKVVGLSQRRTRTAARFQTMAMTAPHPPWADVLLDTDRAAALTDGDPSSDPIPAGMSLDRHDLERALLERIAER